MKVILGFGLVAVVLLAWAGWGFLVEPAVRQPIEFPHKAHLELEEQKLTCTSCHERAEKDAVAGRPSTQKCLSCHSGGEAESEEEKKLQAFGENGGEIPWRRVWRLPSGVFFSHRIHVAARIECQTCHGPVDTLDRPPERALKKLSMAECIRCHGTWEWPVEPGKDETGPRRAVTSRKISDDCGACHR